MNHINTNYKSIITSFVFNTVLHHVSMSWIMETHEQLKYDMENYNPDQITGGTWYNTSICKRSHGTVFEEYIRNARTDIYNFMCYIGAHQKQHPSSIYAGSMVGSDALPLN